MVVINRISLINKLKEKEDEEEGLFKIAKIKPLTAQAGIGAKAEGDITPTDKPIEDFSTPMGKIQYYKSHIDKLEGMAKDGKLSGSAYDAYEYAIRQYNKAIEEYNINLPLIEGLPKSKPEDKPTSFWDIGKDPKMMELQKINFASWRLWFKELKESKDKVAFLKGEGQSPELNKLRRQYNKLAPHMYAKGEKWMTATTMAAYSIGLASELIPLVAKTAPDVIRNILHKAGLQDIGKKELHTALYNVAKGTDTTKQRGIYEAFIKAKETGVPFAERLKGVKIPTITPRFAFGTKLYAGLPADEIAKSIVEVGKVSKELVKGLDPAKVSQVTQALLNVNPALANEFLKAVEKPEVKPVELSKLSDPEQLEATIKGEKPVYLTGIENPDYEKEIKIAKEAGLKVKIGDEKAYAWDLEGKVRATTKDVVIYKPENETRATEVLEVLKTPIKEMTEEYHKKLGRLLGYSEKEVKEFIKEPEPPAEIPKVEGKEPKVNPMAFSDNPLAISRELESYPDDSALIARKAELIFKQHLEGEKVDYPLYIAEQELKLAKTNLKEKFGGDYPEAEKIIKRAETLKTQPKLPTIKQPEKPVYQAQPATEEVVPPVEKAVVEATPKAIPKELEPLAEEARTVVTDIQDKAKSLPKDDFVKEYQETMHKVWEKDRQLYKDIYDYLAKDISENQLKSAQNIWESIKGIKESDKQIYKSENITVKTSWDIIQKLGDDDKRIIRNITEFIKKEYPNKKLTISVGEQPISIAGEEGFRITTPTDAEIDIMFPYYPKIKDTLKKLEKEGISRKELWAGTDIFHELAHTLGIKGEIEADKFSIKMMKKWAKAQATAKPTTEKVAEVPTPKAKAKAYDLKKDLTPEQKIAGKPKPEGAVEIVPKVEVATPAQIKEADILAKEHKLITETPSGKMSDLRYKRLAKNMTGKTSIKDMTKEEADEFIESIKSIVQRKPWEPPIIPLSTKIVPKEFFEIEFKEPDISKIITPKKYYLRILGAEPLLKPTIDSYELLSLKTGEINKWINDVIKKINKEATITQKFKARVLNRPTDKVATMRDLLDKYETPPDSLKPKEKEIFKEVRDFTKDILVKTNEVRNRVGLEPIKDIKTYIPHFLDELAKQIVNKKYPFPEDVKYWLGRNMPKKVYNPTAIERRVRDDLEDFFSKDLGGLLRTLAKYDLRDIYLSEPYSILRAELNALGDKIPASLRKEIDAFLKYDIFNYPTELDQMLNATLKTPTDVINFFLKPLNRTISNPISSLSNIYRQGLMGGAIAMKPRLVLRNVFTQKLLNMNIYPIKDYLKAQFWLTPKGVMEEIRDTTFYKLSIRKFEDLPPLLKPVQWGMYPYSKSHAGINYISNVDVSGKVGYYYGKDMIDWCETSKGKVYIEKYAKKHNLTGKAKNDLTWRKGDEIDEAVEAMSVTQWLYFSTDMPRVFRGKGARAFWSLQSWYMNWFGKHLREGLIRMGGKTSRGRIVRPGDRLNLIKGLIVIYALTEAVKRKTGIDMKRFLFFPFPTYIFPPAMQLILNAYYLITANTDQKRKSAISKLKSNLKLLIPFSGATKRWWQYIKGEITLKEWLFYVEREAKKKKKPEPITIGKPSIEKITTPKINKIKINKISPIKVKF